MKICVYGASGSELDQAYFDAARELGRLLAREGHTLVFGGGARGLMGACAEGAAELGGEIIGVAPRFFDEPGILFPCCSRFIYTETMAERKNAMFDESEAFIAMPGGIGTFEEFFETLTLKQLGRHSKPMALLNTLDYYAPLMATLERAVRDGFLSRRCMELFALCGSPAEALRAVLTQRSPAGGAGKLTDYST
ncbi:MAG: TIGR00730 family Rossman fold protein [Oscillospiraceae bacterium]|nr:TIGR00730 family Rossman fold protein [Oscillospiraceae bacterium]